MTSTKLIRWISGKFDILQELKFINKIHLIVLVATFLYIYIVLLFISFYALNSLTGTQNSTYRLSLQSQIGFGVEPSTSTLAVSILITSILFIFFRLALRSRSRSQVLILFCELITPSLMVLAFMVLGLLFGKVDLALPSLVNEVFLRTFLITPFWKVFTSFAMCILTSLLMAFFLFHKDKTLVSLPREFTFVPWLIPVVLNTGFLAAVTVSSTISRLLLSWVLILIILTLLILISFFSSNPATIRILVNLTVSFSFFIYLFSHRPRQIITWRPDLQLSSLDPDRYFILSLAVAALVFSFLQFFRNFDSSLMIALAGLWAGFSSRIQFTTFASLDNFHYGELIGFWSGFSRFDFIPYRSVEYPRGILVNIIPAAFGNFLSNGYPETFSYWFVFLSLIVGVFFFIVMRQYISTPLIFGLLTILPGARGYVEIDLIMGLTMLFVLTILQKTSFNLLHLIVVLLVPIFLILMAPGQGFIFTFLIAILVTLSVRKNENFAKIVYRKSMLFYYVLILILSLKLVFPSFLWFVRNGGRNNLTYGDDWLTKLFLPQDFPITLKFSVLFLVPFFLVTYLIFFKNLNTSKQYLGLVALVYLFVISGRWFGRVDDATTLSRIGIGFFVFSMIFLIPLVFSKFKTCSSPFFGIFTITLVISLSFAQYPFNQKIDIEQLSSASLMSDEFDEMRMRGQTYKQIQELQNSLFPEGVNLLNITGGQAVDVYLEQNSRGGIHSPYVISNDAQESAWLQRIKESQINFVLGPYSYAFDGSGIGGRSPMVLSWLIKHFLPVKCSNFMLAIRLEEVQEKNSLLSNRGCAVPFSQSEILSFWTQFDATQANLGKSLLSWKSVSQISNLMPLEDNTLINVSLKSVTDLLTIRVDCMNEQRADFYIESNESKEKLSYGFSALIKSGQHSFRPYIFPIVSILDGNFTLKLVSPSCKFIS